MKVLLRRGAPVDAEDVESDADPTGVLGLMSPQTPPVAPERYYSVIPLLVGAGATVKPEWRTSAGKVGDERLSAALGER